MLSPILEKINDLLQAGTNGSDKKRKSAYTAESSKRQKPTGTTKVQESSVKSASGLPVLEANVRGRTVLVRVTPEPILETDGVVRVRVALRGNRPEGRLPVGGVEEESVDERDKTVFHEANIRLPVGGVAASAIPPLPPLPPLPLVEEIPRNIDDMDGLYLTDERLRELQAWDYLHSYEEVEGVPAEGILFDVDFGNEDIDNDFGVGYPDENVMIDVGEVVEV